MRRALVIVAVLFISGAGDRVRADGRQLFNFFADQLGQEIQREQQRQYYEQEQRRQRQQQRENERAYQHMLPNWHACHNGELAACDRALASPMLGAEDRQRLYESRAAILDRQRQEARIQAETKARERDLEIERLRQKAEVEAQDRQRQQAEALRLQRQQEQEQEQRRLAEAQQREAERQQAWEQTRRQQELEQQRQAEIQAFTAAHDRCRSYDVTACDTAVASPHASPQNRSQLLAWRASAQDFESHRVACKTGSIPECDAALASPVANEAVREALIEWRAMASPIRRTLAYATETGSIAASNVRALPVSTLVMTAVAGLVGLALLLVMRRTHAVPVAVSAAAPVNQIPQPSRLVHRLTRKARHVYVRSLANFRRPKPATPAVAAAVTSEPRDPVAALAALELAQAFMSGVADRISAAEGNPAQAAQFLNELSLASRQLDLAGRADPGAVLTIEDDGATLTFNLTELKARALFLEGVCRSEADPNRAIRILTQAAELEPMMVRAHYSIGLLEAQLYRKARAIAALERAVALEPKNLDFRKDLQRVRNISVGEIAFEQAAAGTRKTIRGVKIAGTCLAGILVISLIANLADPVTRGPFLIGIFVILFTWGMVVNMVKSVWANLTGRG